MRNCSNQMRKKMCFLHLACACICCFQSLLGTLNNGSFRTVKQPGNVELVCGRPPRMHVPADVMGQKLLPCISRNKSDPHQGLSLGIHVGLFGSVLSANPSRSVVKTLGTKLFTCRIRGCFQINLMEVSKDSPLLD